MAEKPHSHTMPDSMLAPDVLQSLSQTAPTVQTSDPRGVTPADTRVAAGSCPVGAHASSPDVREADRSHDLALAPSDIERESLRIIRSELGSRFDALDPLVRPVVLRAIHTTADFSYADTLSFSPGPQVVAQTLDALAAGGVTILTDTNMGLAGISKPSLARLGCMASCFMADADVAEAARARGTTRAVASMDKACEIEGPLIIAVGNAPTALLRINELRRAGRLDPLLVIGVPVGFVHVVESKEELLASGTPCIVSRGRKGGSNVAAAIVNALLYMLTRPGADPRAISDEALSDAGEQPSAVGHLR